MVSEVTPSDGTRMRSHQPILNPSPNKNSQQRTDLAREGGAKGYEHPVVLEILTKKHLIIIIFGPGPQKPSKVGVISLYPENHSRKIYKVMHF